MTEADLPFATIEKVAAMFRQRKLSPLELTQLLLARIERLNPVLNAYLTVTAEFALAQARAADRELLGPRGRRRDRGLLHGIPISLKDNIYTAGIRTTAGSAILRDLVPAEDAAVTARLRRAGAVLLGKTNMHEFAYGVTSNNPHYGPARNPWNRERIPGGSSGGSAAALAAGLCFASVGTDTGGSIRIPAALCNVVGLKPTFGRVSVFGTVPLATSLDHVGPLGRTVADAAIVLQAIAGRDPRDSATASQRVPDFLDEMRKPLRRFRLGWPRQYFWDRVDQGTFLLCKAAAFAFERLGARIVEISVPQVIAGDKPSTDLALAEAFAYHQARGWYPARGAEYGADVRERLELGRDVRATALLDALEARKAVRAEWDAAFTQVDAIVAPTVPFPAPRIGEESLHLSYGEEKIRPALLRLNRPANFSGLPAISIPSGFTKAGLPVGLQLIGPAFCESNLLRIAQACERAHSWHRRKPNLAPPTAVWPIRK